MDKTSKRFMTGRLRIAVSMAVCLIAIVALPTVAYAAPAWVSAYPAPGSTIHSQPSLVTVDLFGTSKLNATTAAIKIDNVAQKTFLTQGAASGHWVATETESPIGSGIYKTTWTWTPDNTAAYGSTKANIYCYPATLAEGVHNVSVTVKDMSNPVKTFTYSWSFTITSPPTFGTPTPYAGTTVNTITPTVSVPVSDITSLAYVDFTVNGVYAGRYTFSGAPKTGVASLKIGPLADGPVTVLAQAFDGTGNRADKTWTFNVSTINQTCITPACHGTVYNTDPAMGPDCVSCHSGAFAPHQNNTAVHAASPASETITISGVSFGMHACSECHIPLNLLNLHNSVCVTCHPAPRNTLTPSWNKSCVQGGCHTAGSTAPMHASIDASHAIPADKAACLAAGCHDAGAITPFAGKSVAELHANATTTTPSGTRTSCQICHAPGVTPTTNCLASGCHPERALPHGYDPAKHTSTVTTGTITILGTAYTNQTCADCHNLELGPLHIPPGTCASCHPSPRDTLTPSWNKTCTQGGCHTAGSGHEMHANVDASHTVGPYSCTAAGCHPGAGDLAAIHSNATTTTPGGTLTSCQICHAPGRTPSATCSDCHDMGTPHGNVSAFHAATLTTATITFFDDSSDHGADNGFGEIDTNVTCSMCHGSMNLVSLHGNNCAQCHFGSAPPAHSFTTWAGGCSQGSCHPSYHDTASSGHNSVYLDNGNYGRCSSCHWIVPYTSVTPIDATTDWCGGCHTMLSDPTPPRTTCNASTAYAYAGPQTFTLAATDINGSGVAHTYWQLDSTSGSWTTGTSVPVPAPSSGVASHTIYFYSTDIAGNVETTKSVTVRIAPGITPGGTISASGVPVVFTVPAGVTSLTADLYGGMGGGSTSYGARLRAKLVVTPGQVLMLKVGQRASGATGGWGGGSGGNGTNGATGGGGSTSVGILSDGVLAEAGGGGGSAGSSTGGPGGSYNASTSGGGGIGWTYSGSPPSARAGGGGGWTGGAYGSSPNSPGTGGTSHVVGNVYLTFSASGNTTGDGQMILTW